MVLFVFALYLVLMILNALSNAMWWPNVAGPDVTMMSAQLQLSWGQVRWYRGRLVLH